MHIDDALIAIAGIFTLGIAAQWLAWRLRLPSILILLSFGFLAGPISGILDVDALLGNLLFPLVSLAVGIILFEGGLSLKFDDIRTTGPVIRNLITIGALVTWVLSSAAAYFVLGLNIPLAVQFGAILIVTGPTVIGPLLRLVQPSGQSASILRWEGILIDPVGATIAVLVFDAILIGDLQQAVMPTIINVVLVIFIGGVTGFLGGRALIELLRRYLIPDYLQSAFTLMVVITVFALSETVQHESGLLAATVMGIVMVNQHVVSVRRISEFKEDIGVLLISVLFILLAARLKIADLRLLGVETIIFIALLLLVIRPATVLISTFRSKLKTSERIFLSWMAPRGIVAASVASIFALRLETVNHPQAQMLVPLTFAVIIATCSIYGLTALPLARRLNLSQANPQGVLIIGAHSWARDIARALHELKFKVILIDTNWNNVSAARLMGLNAVYGSAVSDEIPEGSLDGIGRALALTSNGEVNALAAMHYRHEFGRKEVYQLPFRPKQSPNHNGDDTSVSRELRGRTLFRSDAFFAALDGWFASEGVVKATALTREFDYAAYQKQYGDSAMPLFIQDPVAGTLTVVTADMVIQPQPGQTVISVVRPLEPMLVDVTAVTAPDLHLDMQ